MTYLGFSEEDGSMVPHVSVHSVPLLDDEYDVIFTPELNNNGLTAELMNKVYFQVVSKPKNSDSKVEHIEFYQAVLAQGENIIEGRVKHVHNGRSMLEFRP